MKKDNTLTSAKEVVKSTAGKVIKSTEETAEAAIKMASDVVTKENVEKTLNAVKDTAKTVKSKATKAATAAKKTVAKKIDIGFYVQYGGKEVSKQFLLDKIHEEWLKSHKLSEIKTLDIYLKVEDNTAYCLVNGEINIDLKL
ncbi:MAG: hypothetical protein H7Y18_04745 [Clostridiaceae bacterium]|nr:hypothetical protein [Clostridiaceae bacterium]